MIAKYAIALLAVLIIGASFGTWVYTHSYWGRPFEQTPATACKVDISKFPPWQNYTASMTELQWLGYGPKTSVYLSLQAANVTELDIKTTQQPIFARDVSGFAWVREGYSPYTFLNNTGSHWGTTFPAKDEAPVGVRFDYSVYGQEKPWTNWYGSFFAAYNLQSRYWEFSPFHPRVGCLAVP